MRSAVDWNNVKAFVAVVRAGSISEAARSAGMSIATLSRRIDQLEHATSLKLLLRSSSGVTVTQEGASFYRATHDAQIAMDTVQRVARSLQAREAELPVRVSATETVITTLLAPRLAALKSLEHAPRIDLLVSYENADLSKREADMAIRLAEPVQETLVARKLGTIHSQLYASNDYFARRNPTTATLKQQEYLLLDDRYGDIPEVVWAREQGFTARALMLSSSTLALLEAAKRGQGIGLFPEYLARCHGLIRVDYPVSLVRPLWMVFHKSARNDPRIKQVRTWVASSVKAGLAGE